MKTLALIFIFISTAALADYYGSYNNPIEDEIGGDLSGPVHRGMYCINSEWHHGWLRAWETSPVIKDSCGDAVEQLPY
jgi:hypothetical protein